MKGREGEGEREGRTVQHGNAVFCSLSDNRGTGPILGSSKEGSRKKRRKD